MIPPGSWSAQIVNLMLKLGAPIRLRQPHLTSEEHGEDETHARHEYSRDAREY
jgi:hypothetical protein